MKLFEKILLGIVLFTFLTQTFVASEAYSYIPLFFLAISYLIGGYWLFNDGDLKQIFAPIASGILLACSIFTLPFSIHLSRVGYLLILSAADGLLLLILIIYVLAKRGFSNTPSNIKGLLIRAFVTCVVTSFFSYTPLIIKPFQQIIYLINKGNEKDCNNILMKEYIEDYNKVYAEGDCDQAIFYAEKANYSGRIWLGKISDHPERVNGHSDTSATITINDLLPDTLKLSPEDLNALENKMTHSAKDTIGLWRISITYDNLYNAYKCKADDEYEKNNFEFALKYYLKADSAACLFYEKAEPRVWSLKNIALCCQKLKRYKESDSLLIKAINICLTSKDTFSRTMASVISDLARSYSNQRFYSTSNHFFRIANNMYRKDSLNKDSKEDLLSNYCFLTKNFIALDSMDQAQFYVQKAFALEKPQTEEYCNTSLYYGICLYRLSEYEKADSILKSCLQCFQSKYKPDHPLIAVCDLTLAYVDFALAKYSDVKKYLDVATTIIARSYGIRNSQYAQCLMLSGELNKALSEYNKAETDFKSALDIYDRERDDADKASTLTNLAHLDIILSRFPSARARVDDVSSLAAPSIALGQPQVTGLLNQVGYVYYALGSYKQSDTLYTKTLSINSHFGLSHTASTAIALNGLGLNATAKRNFIRADSLFAQALKLHLYIFHEKNPFTAQLYLNYGLLNIEEGKVAEAEEKINRALEIDKAFFKPEHDIFGDIYVGLGDLSKKKGQREAAREYYQKALEIYSAKFGPDHWKVVITKSRL